MPLKIVWAPSTCITDLMLVCSPHILTLRERISIGGELISAAEFDDLVRQQEQTLLQCREQEASALSHFEVMTALAYKHFQQQQATTLSSFIHSPLTANLQPLVSFCK